MNNEGKPLYPYEPDLRISIVYLENQTVLHLNENTFFDFKTIFLATLEQLRRFDLIKEDMVCWSNEPSIWHEHELSEEKNEPIKVVVEDQGQDGSSDQIALDINT